MRLVWLTALAALFLGGSPAAALTPAHRLGHEVIPSEESVRLVLNADRRDYTGDVSIALRVPAPTDSFQFHALELDLKRVTLRGRRGPVPMTWRVGEHGVITARTRVPLAPGAYTLSIAFANDFDTRANALYRMDTGGHGYVFSQFESIAAREAFPCWDEPEFKIPWRVTLTVPRAQIAVSNAPAASVRGTGATRIYTFEPTAPLPSYLLAMAVGPFDVVPIRGMSVPGRVITVKGAGRLAGETVRLAPKLLAALERWFGRPYPYRKLDLIAAPDYYGGAMENAGAIVFRDDIVLFDPKSVGADDREGMVGTLAHEMAHMWFGDLVTMAWWDDLWLNESFASWMGDKIGNEVMPVFDFPVRELFGTERAMRRDARPSTRAIRQPVDAFDNIDQLFDEIAYQKGQAVLGMLEAWIGPEAFQRGVREYLAAHVNGNATSADLWAALAHESGREDVATVAASFVDRPGVPLVDVAWTKGGLLLRQERFHSLGAPRDSAAVVGARWIIPARLRVGYGHWPMDELEMLADSEIVLSSSGHEFLRAWNHWLEPNASARGYYRWRLPAADLDSLVAHADVLEPRERVGLIQNTVALLDAGDLHGDQALNVIARFETDPDPNVVAAVIAGLGRVRAVFETPENEPAFAAVVRRTLGPARDRFGLDPRPGERASITLLRPSLLETLGGDGRDPAVLAHARALVDTLLRRPDAVDPTLAGVVLRLAARDGDASRFDLYRERFEQATLPVDRLRFLQALGSFRDTTLVARALDYALTGPLRANEVLSIPTALDASPANADRVFEWSLRNADAVVAKLPAWARSRVVRLAGGCSETRVARARAFYAGRADRLPGLATDLDQVEDATRECARLRDREGDAVTRALLRAGTP